MCGPSARKPRCVPSPRPNCREENLAKALGPRSLTPLKPGWGAAECGLRQQSGKRRGATPTSCCGPGGPWRPGPRGLSICFCQVFLALLSFQAAFCAGGAVSVANDPGGRKRSGPDTEAELSRFGWAVAPHIAIARLTNTALQGRLLRKAEKGATSSREPLCATRASGYRPVHPSKLPSVRRIHPSVRSLSVFLSFHPPICSEHLFHFASPASVPPLPGSLSISTPPFPPWGRGRSPRLVQSGSSLGHRLENCSLPRSGLVSDSTWREPAND